MSFPNKLDIISISGAGYTIGEDGQFSASTVNGYGVWLEDVDFSGEKMGKFMILHDRHGKDVPFVWYWKSSEKRPFLAFSRLHVARKMVEVGEITKEMYDEYFGD